MNMDQLFDRPPRFETARLQMRLLTLEDVADYYAIASSPVVAAETICRRHETMDDTIGYLQRVKHQYENREAIHWGIVWKETSTLIGRTGLILIDPVHEKAELGYVISDQYWNQGIATEATYPLLNYAFHEIGFNRIEARCNANNRGSYRVMEKLGLTFEGVLRKQLNIQGTYMDQKLYSILKEEYGRGSGGSSLGVSSRNRMELRLQRATISDIPVLAVMNKQLIEDEQSANPMGIKELEGRMQEFFDADWKVDFIMCEEERIGYALYQYREASVHREKKQVYVRQYFIGREHRNRGYGKAGVELLIKCRFQGVQSIEIDVLETNPEGKRFWDKAGFKPYFTNMRLES